MNPKGYQAYKEQSVSTMTRSEMLLLLYDEMLKRLTRAQFALEKEDLAVFDQSVTRVQEIVRYLIETLNFQYPVSRDLKRMYDYFLHELARLEAGRHVEIIGDLQGLTRDLRDAFAQAATQSNV